MVRIKLPESGCVSSPGRDKTSRSYETVTQVEGRFIKKNVLLKPFV